MKMIRTAIQWLIAQKVDDGLSLGVFLSWVVRHDLQSRRYHENLLRLQERLGGDALALMENAAPESGRKPLKIVCRSVFALGRTGSARDYGRQRIQKILAGLSFLFVFGAGAFLSGRYFPAETTGYAVASPSSETASGTITLNDPVVRNELIRLCRQSPNESGPFFIEPIR